MKQVHTHNFTADSSSESQGPTQATSDSDCQLVTVDCYWPSRRRRRCGGTALADCVTVTAAGPLTVRLVQP